MLPAPSETAHTIETYKENNDSSLPFFQKKHLKFLYIAVCWSTFITSLALAIFIPYTLLNTMTAFFGLIISLLGTVVCLKHYLNDIRKEHCAL